MEYKNIINIKIKDFTKGAYFSNTGKYIIETIKTPTINKKSKRRFGGNDDKNKNKTGKKKANKGPLDPVKNIFKKINIMTNKSPKLFCFRTIILNKGIYPNTTNNIPYCIGLKVIPDNRPCNPPLSSFIKRFADSK